MAVTRTRTVGTLITVGCVMVVVLSASPAVARSAHPSAEALAVRLINQEREARGLRPLTRNLQMVRHARTWSATMAARGRVGHRENLAVVVDGAFRRLGENVGYTRGDGVTAAALVARLHRAFMGSSGHRQHVIGDYKMVGVGIFHSADGGMWMTANFVKGPRDGFPLYGDIGGARLQRRVGRLFLRGVLDGCGGNRYCPKRAATRAELARTLRDATGNRQAVSVMAAGCSTRSCATEPVTRVEAARMMAAALQLQPIEGRRFYDVARADRGVVNAVVDAGILTGCTRLLFCSAHTISRGQLARMVHRALR